MKDIYYGSGTVVFDEAYNFWVILSRSRGGVTIQKLAEKSSPKYLLYAKLRHYRPLAVQVGDKGRKIYYAGFYCRRWNFKRDFEFS
jgi:hypothetical protein